VQNQIKTKHHEMIKFGSSQEGYLLNSIWQKKLST